ncbi:hypothetical protein GGX14DRAFT_636745 [Mycena pura]|uniref:Uncharacterized protein n=1 Tax=Mycena pura TaxID=153505 RepID=A0AAD6Y8I9_9AGAR|nr:hypothetical protein GGX14DRAFT_636745 [Mycena pura]
MAHGDPTRHPDTAPGLPAECRVLQAALGPRAAAHAAGTTAGGARAKQVDGHALCELEALLTLEASGTAPAALSARHPSSPPPSSCSPPAPRTRRPHPLQRPTPSARRPCQPVPSASSLHVTRAVCTPPEPCARLARRLRAPPPLCTPPPPSAPRLRRPPALYLPPRAVGTLLPSFACRPRGMHAARSSARHPCGSPPPVHSFSTPPCTRFRRRHALVFDAARALVFDARPRPAPPVHSFSRPAPPTHTPMNVPGLCRRRAKPRGSARARSRKRAQARFERPVPPPPVPPRARSRECARARFRRPAPPSPCDALFVPAPPPTPPCTTCAGSMELARIRFQCSAAPPCTARRRRRPAPPRARSIERAQVHPGVMCTPATLCAPAALQQLVPPPCTAHRCSLFSTPAAAATFHRCAHASLHALFFDVRRCPEPPAHTPMRVRACFPRPAQSCTARARSWERARAVLDTPRCRHPAKPHAARLYSPRTLPCVRGLILDPALPPPCNATTPLPPPPQRPMPPTHAPGPAAAALRRPTTPRATARARPASRGFDALCRPFLMPRAAAALQRPGLRLRRRRRCCLCRRPAPPNSLCRCRPLCFDARCRRRLYQSQLLQWRCPVRYQRRPRVIETESTYCPRPPQSARSPSIQLSIFPVDIPSASALNQPGPSRKHQRRASQAPPQRQLSSQECALLAETIPLRRPSPAPTRPPDNYIPSVSANGEIPLPPPLHLSQVIPTPEEPHTQSWYNREQEQPAQTQRVQSWYQVPRRSRSNTTHAMRRSTCASAGRKVAVGEDGPRGHPRGRAERTGIPAVVDAPVGRVARAAPATRERRLVRYQNQTIADELTEAGPVPLALHRPRMLP